MPAPWSQNPPVPKEPKPPRPFWMTWKFYDRLSNVLIPVGLIYWITTAGNPKEQFTISSETTVVTEPINAEGLIDYAAAIRLQYQDELHSPDNAARLLLEAVGPSVFNRPWQSEQVYEQLGMDPLPMDGDYFVSLSDVVDQMATASGSDVDERDRLIWDVEDIYQEIPWVSDDAPELAEWIAVNEIPLAKIVAASRMPFVRSPLFLEPGESLIASRSIYNYEIRELLRSLRLRAMQSVAVGDLESAWSDLLAVQRLGRLISHDVTRIDYVVGTGVAMSGMKSMSALLSSPEMTPQLLDRIRRDWRQLPDWGDPSTSLNEFERYAVLDVMQRTARFGVPYLVHTRLMSRRDRVPMASAVHRLFNACIDWDASMYHVNHWYDDLATAAGTADGVARDHLMDGYVTKFDSMREDLRDLHLPTPDVVSDWCVALMMPLPETIEKHLNTLESHIALVETVFAIEEYRLANGESPATLGDLVPTWLSEVPHDPFSRTEELCYRIDGPHAYVVYSVNEDGYDDRAFTEHEDISFRVRMPTPEWLLPEETDLALAPPL